MTDYTILLQLTIDGLTRGAMYGLMATGLALIFGIVRVINMGHGELFMLGAYAMYFLTTMVGLPPVLGIVGASAFLFVLGMVMERGLIAPLRARLGENWLVDGYVLTIGLMVILQNAALMMFGPREYGVASFWPGRVELGDLVIANERIVILIAAVVLASGLGAFLHYTSVGRAIRATAEHPRAAQALGINTSHMYTLTFGIGSALAGAVGAILLSIYPAFPTVGGEILLKAFVVVIVGGLGNVWGAMLAGPLLGLIEAYSTAFVSGGWQNTTISVVVILVLFLRPQGLFSKQVTRP